MSLLVHASAHDGVISQETPWILNVCIGFTHNNDTEKNKINKFFVELYQEC